MKTYSVREKIPEHIDENLKAYPELMRSLLFYRGIEDAESAQRFLNPDYERDTHDPFLMLGMEKAVQRIMRAMEREEKIVIYGDYDCDGIPGSVVLHDFFQKIGYTNFQNYIPHRYNEGYGFSVCAVEQFGRDGTRLIITVDVGITDCEAVERANELGIDVIITDHHLPLIDSQTKKEIIPKAYAILNTKQAEDNYPYDMLCGAGTAFKLVQGILRFMRAHECVSGDCIFGCNARREREVEGAVLSATANEHRSLQQSSAPKIQTPPEGWEKWLLDMAGLATIADMVPLTGENRALAHFGLKVLRKSPRPGLLHLLRASKVPQRTLSEDDVGFMIAPRINAASRMGEPREAFELFATRDEVHGGALAERLQHLNDQRKGCVAAMIKEARKALAKREEKELVVLGNPSWMPGLVGLAANTLMEEMRKPVFVWGRNGTSIIKGSCRSDGSVNIVELMSAAPSGTFLDLGGHALSGGFSVSLDRLHTLENVLCDAYQKTKKITVGEGGALYDGVLSLDAVDGRLYAAIEQLAPFGIDNPKPIFLFENIEVREAARFGRDNAHLRLSFSKSNGAPVQAIRFFYKEDETKVVPSAGTRVNLAATLEQSFFRGRAELRLRVVDIIQRI